MYPAFQLVRAMVLLGLFSIAPLFGATAGATVPWVRYEAEDGVRGGTALLLASASKRLVDPTFYVKMVFIFAGVAVLQLTRNRVFRSLGPDGALPESAKILAWAGLICWVGAVTAGRLLAYI